MYVRIPQPEYRPEPKLVAPEQPLYARVAGAALRAGFGAIGLIPMLIPVGGSGARMRRWRTALAIFVVAAFIAFALERRGSKTWKVSLRLGVALAIATLLAPLATIWIANVGDPAAGFLQLAKSFRVSKFFDLLGYAVGIALAAPLLGLWFYVRNRTSKTLPQLGAAFLTVALPAILLASMGISRHVVRGSTLAFVVPSGLLVVGLVCLAERLISRFDPHAPIPDGKPLRPVFRVGAVAILAVTLVFALVKIPYDERAHELQPRVMKEDQIVRFLQSSHRRHGATSRSRGPHGRRIRPPQPPGNMAELFFKNELSRGTYEGHVFRMIRGAEDPETWTLMIDPVHPAVGRKHYATTDTGEIFVSSEPVRVDPDLCEILGDVEELP